ncbi:MAG: Gfo/Idh/MocA family oxidoreductase [Ignavibacteriaceae bacterium]|nr:Gfo/Idh/MocA family oxidoreductase [Ignavibacteriaceae bacterium]
MEKTNVAVIGLGGISQLVHLPNLLKMNNVKISGVAEVNKNRLHSVADKFNISNRYTNYQTLLEETEAEVIIVATPTHTHRDIAIDCLSARKDVLVEKPLARTYEEAKEIVETAKRNKRKLMVGMNMRFRPDLMLLRSLVSAGEIGEPFYVKCGWIRTQSSFGKWFTRKEESGGGVLFDLGISLIDMSLWLLDYPPVDSLSSQCYYHYTKNVEDTAFAFIKCKNSSLINIETSWSLPVEKDYFYLTIYGSNGNASINPLKIVKRIEDRFIDLTPNLSETSLSMHKKSYLNELKNFIGAVKDLNPLFCTGDEALSRMKILSSIYESANSNKEVKI